MTQTLPVLSFAKLETGCRCRISSISRRARSRRCCNRRQGRRALRRGLERVFKDVFPIADVNGNYSLEFVKYALGEPKYTVEECIERDMTIPCRSRRPCSSW